MARITNNYSKRRRRRLISIGDLNTKIQLQTREMYTKFETGLVDIENFKGYNEVWSLIETGKGIQQFDGVTLNTAYTHFIYIRYRKDVNMQTWIWHNDKRYDIVDIEDLDDRHEFLLLRCKETGTDEVDNEASWTG